MNLSSRTFAFQVIGIAIALNALAGIAVLLGSGSLSETEERILLTVVTVSVLSVGLLPAALGWKRVRIEDLPVLPAISAGALTLAATVLMLEIWREIDDGDAGAQSFATLLIFGIATGHLCLLHLARDSELRWIATALTIVLAVILLEAVWAADEPDWRLTGITAILWLASSLLVPIRHWAAGTPRAISNAVDVESVRYCPYCGERVDPDGEVIVCPSCDASFQVTNVASRRSVGWRRKEPVD